ncbi:MAG: von Willebrand factor type A domain-containing protein [Chitinophagaceae bacterium]
MLRSVLITALFLVPLFASGQYYIKGKITDDGGKMIGMVKMKLRSTGFLYQNGSSGEFGIPSRKKYDTVICFVQGYDSVRAPLFSGVYNTIVMKPTFLTLQERSSRLSSLTNNLLKDPEYIRHVYDETYSSTVENDFIDAAKFPVTGFSVNVNKASYSNVRRFINNKTEMPTDAVRIEEMLNYFSLSCTPPPVGADIFNLETRVSSCPWNDANLLLFINAQAKKMDLDKVPPSNLVFLIDDSGSMDMPNRLPLLKAAFRMLVNNLRNTDTVTLVTYGGTAGVMLEPTSGIEKQKIIEAIEGLTPAGSTPGSSGLKLAYEIAKSNFIKNGNNRVILATDGDFNVGQTDEKELEELIIQYRNTGVFLTCLGVGMGNYKDSKLEVLARFGNGNFSYIDNEREAEKVLVKEFAQTVVAIAGDTFLSLDFNPDWVKEYRLIGFDNKQDAVTDSSSVLDGGEIGSGHSLIAMVEIVPRKKARVDWLNNPTVAIGELKLQYKLPALPTPQHVNKPVLLNYSNFTSLDRQLRFATSVAMFGQLLKQSRFAANYDFDTVSAIATDASAPTDLLQQEFLKLVQEAKKIYVRDKGKKKRKKRKE